MTRKIWFCFLLSLILMACTQNNISFNKVNGVKTKFGDLTVANDANGNVVEFNGKRTSVNLDGDYFMSTPISFGNKVVVIIRSDVTGRSYNELNFIVISSLGVNYFTEIFDDVDSKNSSINILEKTDRLLVELNRSESNRGHKIISFYKFEGNLSIDGADNIRNVFDAVDQSTLAELEKSNKYKKGFTPNIDESYSVCRNITGATDLFYKQIGESIGVLPSYINIVGSTVTWTCHVTIQTPKGLFNCLFGKVYSENDGDTYYVGGVTDSPYINNSCVRPYNR